MFTGIIESLGQVERIYDEGTNRSFEISSSISHELRIDQSVSHNGVCLTVESVADGSHRVTAIAETLEKTTLRHWKKGDLINLERCLPFNGRLDGHLVQGHVDATALCVDRVDRSGSWEYVFEFPDRFTNLVIEKGSISLDGTSLTIFDVTNSSFRVAIIPYTFEHTAIRNVQKGTEVNIEFDMVGKYVSRIMRR